MHAAASDVPPLVRCLLEFVQVCLSLDEVCMKIDPAIFMLQLGLLGFAVFLELPRFYNKAVRNSYGMSFDDGLICRCCSIDKHNEPYIEALEKLIGFP